MKNEQDEDFKFDDFDFDMEEFDAPDDIFDGEVSFDVDTRIMMPKKHKMTYKVRYSYAKDLANKINLLDKGRRYYVQVSGSFIFGDLIEALCVKYQWHVKRMTISSLSFSQNNVDSLVNLLEGDYIDELNIIASARFYAREKHALVRYMYEKLDKANKFQLAICRWHSKIVLIETHAGDKIIMHGSANMPSHDCIEQFCIEHDDDMFDFSQETADRLLKYFGTINKDVPYYKQKPVGGADIWQKIGLEAVRKLEK